MPAADQPLTVEIRPSRMVAGLVVLLAALALASTAAWLMALEPDAPVQRAGAALGVLLSVAAVAIALRRLRQPPLLLGWDGRQWWLAHPPAGRERPHWQGDLRLVWRLGRCWLLRGHVVPGAPGGSAALWLSVDARALDARGHALLCALYCARPLPADGAPDGRG